MLAQVVNKDTRSVVKALIGQTRKLPNELRNSLTWDRGKELTDHKRFTVATDIDVYFCDPHSPSQRDSNENTNRLIRQYLPKGIDLSVYSQVELIKVARDPTNDPERRYTSKLRQSDSMLVLCRPAEPKKLCSLLKVVISNGRSSSFDRWSYLDKGKPSKLKAGIMRLSRAHSDFLFIRLTRCLEGQFLIPPFADVARLDLQVPLTAAVARQSVHSKLALSARPSLLTHELRSLDACDMDLSCRQAEPPQTKRQLEVISCVFSSSG